MTAEWDESDPEYQQLLQAERQRLRQSRPAARLALLGVAIAVGGPVLLFVIYGAIAAAFLDDDAGARVRMGGVVGLLMAAAVVAGVVVLCVGLWRMATKFDRR